MPPGESRSMILARMKSMRHAYSYREVLLLDVHGKPLLSTSTDAPPPGSPTLEVMKEAIGAQSIIFLDIGLRGESGDMGVAAPLLALHDGKPEAICFIFRKTLHFFHVSPAFADCWLA
jgi:hypothetical protein